MYCLLLMCYKLVFYLISITQFAIYFTQNVAIVVISQRAELTIGKGRWPFNTVFIFRLCRTGHQVGGLLLPFHSSFLRDGDQLPWGMDRSSRLWVDGATAGEFRQRRIQHFIYRLLKTTLHSFNLLYIAICICIYAFLQGLISSLSPHIALQLYL